MDKEPSLTQSDISGPDLQDVKTENNIRIAISCLLKYLINPNLFISNLLKVFNTCQPAGGKMKIHYAFFAILLWQAKILLYNQNINCQESFKKSYVTTCKFTIPINVLLNASKVLKSLDKKKEVVFDLLSCLLSR